MRAGSVSRRCSRCKTRVESRTRRCPNCQHETFSWGFVVDANPAGDKRLQRKGNGFATKGEAIAAMSELQVGKAAGTFIDPSKLTIGQYLVTWLAAAKGAEQIRATTWKTYDVAIRCHITPRIGHVPLQQLTRIQVRALYTELRESGRAKGTGGLSAKSVHNVHLALRKALGDAVDDGLLRANAAAKGHRQPPRPEMRTWSGEQLHSFMEHLAADRNYALYRLSSQTGMRRGEVLGLHWSDVDFGQARVSVRQQLVRQGAEVVLGPPKTRAGRRSIALDPVTVDALRDHREAQAFERNRWGDAYQDHDLVFCRPDGHPHDPDVITHQFERLAAAAGLPRIRLHDLRHGMATMALEAGVHVKVVSERLGHASVAITLDLYSHVVPAMEEDAALRIAAVVDGR